MAIRVGRGMWFVAALVVWLLLAWLLFGQSGRFSLGAVRLACGSAAPDVQPFVSAAYLRQFVQGCGAAGRSAYRDLQLVDLLYPFISAAVQVGVLWWLAKRLRVGWPRALVAFPVLAALGDYVENCGAWAWIRKGGGAPLWSSWLFQAGSALKVCASAATWLALLMLGVWVVGRYIGERRARSKRRAAATA